MIIINIDVINNNNARAKLICAVIIINKGKNPGKVLVQSIQSTNPDFLPLIINIITVPVVHTMADIRYSSTGDPYWVPVARVGDRILKIELPCPIVTYEISDFPEILISIKKL